MAVGAPSILLRAGCGSGRRRSNSAVCRRLGRAGRAGMGSRTLFGSPRIAVIIQRHRRAGDASRKQGDISMTLNAGPDVEKPPAATALPLTVDGQAIRVLFVEDDAAYREALSGELTDQGFVVRGFADGASLLRALDGAVDADVILLDWALPHTAGIDLLPQMRRRGIRLPVVFLTGRASTTYESLAFDRGAIDFIDKVRGIDVLVRRLRRIVQAAKPASAAADDKRMVCGKLVLRPAISRAYWNGTDVGLTLGEYNIVHLLASNVGRYMSYRAIYDKLHYEGFIAGQGDQGYRANVRSAIKRIRNKFRDVDPTFGEIENYMAFGYCWGTPSGLG